MNFYYDRSWRTCTSASLSINANFVGRAPKTQTSPTKTRSSWRMFAFTSSPRELSSSVVQGSPLQLLRQFREAHIIEYKAVHIRRLLDALANGRTGAVSGIRFDADNNRVITSLLSL
jgi:hypothetical protein